MVTSMATLSVIIITQNEAHNIERCLASVKWADEIIIVDSGSTDDTLQICQRYTQKIFQQNWLGFGPQKNFALSKAEHEWVLSLDADEWLSEGLQQEIKNVIQTDQCEAYELLRRNSYCGQFLKYGDIGRDKIIRLFKRNHAKFSNDVVHEKVICNGSVGTLKNVFFHESYLNLEELLQRLNQYTTLSAASRYQSGKKSSLLKALFNAGWAFIKAYCLRGGFLDGRIGLIAAISSAESSYYRHAKLWLLLRK